MKNSIDRESPEDSRQDLQGGDAIGRIRDIVKESSTCFFCTRVSHGGSDGVRPMGVQQVDEFGNLWFMSAKDSHKNSEIAEDDSVALLFQGSEHSGFMHLTGRASVVQDRAKLDEVWTPLAKVWFTEGKDDPRISLIKVEPQSGYYWDNKHGDMVAGIKMLVGAAIGKTIDDSVHGQIKP
jgi:general stress protein 26